MLSNGSIRESRENAIVFQQASPASIRVFISFLVCGYPIVAEDADAAEVWLLAHMYDVNGIKEWISANCIDKSTIAAAMEFALSVASASDVCPDLLKACEIFLRRQNPHIIARSMPAHLMCSKSARILVENIRFTEDMWDFIMRWHEAHGSNKSVTMNVISSLIQLRRFPPPFLFKQVRESGIVSQCIQVFARVQSAKIVTIYGLNPFEDDVQSLIRKIQEKTGCRNYNKIAYCGQILYNGDCSKLIDAGIVDESTVSAWMF
jgi:hypothetical protein